MAAESFFDRWSKRNAEAAAERQAMAPLAPAQEPPPPPPTLEEVALLTPDADFTRFVARGVDETVRRSALKKLFADPRFNVMDGLDVYIEDYHSFTPIPAAMLATLNHARTLLDPLGRLASSSAPPPEPPESAPESVPDDSASEPESSPEKELPDHGDPVQGM